MLTRLLVNPGMMWPRRVASEGKVGMLSCVAAMEVMYWPVVVLIVMVGAVRHETVSSGVGVSNGCGKWWVVWWATGRGRSC